MTSKTKTDPMSKSAADLLAHVSEAYAKIDDPRLKKVVLAAIRHLHEFVDETQLTRSEWSAGLALLTRAGQASNPKRQEFILMSDLLGVSTAVDKLDYGAAQDETPSSVEGPFYVPGSPDIPVGGSIIIDDIAGAEPAVVKGYVRGADGQPVSDAILDVWQTAPNQRYAVTDDAQSDMNLRGRMHVDESGYYEFHTVKPVPYSVPVDGPAGALVRISNGHGMRAAHIHVFIEAPGHKDLVTQIYPTGDPYLQSDAAFGISDPLIVDFCEIEGDTGPAYMAEFDFVLKPI